MTDPIRPDLGLIASTAAVLRLLGDDRHDRFRGLVGSATYTAITGYEQNDAQKLFDGLTQLLSYIAAAVVVEAGQQP